MYKVRIEKSVQKTLEKINDPFYSKIKMQFLNLLKIHARKVIKN